MTMFQKATRKSLKARLALVGPSGSGKTLTALKIAKGLGGRVAVIDSEHRSASRYAGDPDVPTFDVCELSSFAPQTYIAAIREAEKEGYDVLIIDSLSHAWAGKKGALEQVDLATARSRSHNSFSDGWRAVTPLQNELIDTILGSAMHVIATMRVKTEYIPEKNAKGQMVPRKVGLAPVQRNGVEYEFDIVGDLDAEHNLVIGKSRCRALAGEAIAQPTEALGQQLKTWLDEGEPEDAEAIEKADPGVVAEISGIVQELGLEQQVQEMLGRAGADDYAGLDVEKAATMLAWLKNRREQAQKMATAQVPKNGSALDALTAAIEGAS